MVNSLKIKERLNELGFTQFQLAKYLGVSPPTVSHKINNIRPINLEEAEKICKFLKIADIDFGKYFFASF